MNRNSIVSRPIMLALSICSGFVLLLLTTIIHAQGGEPEPIYPGAIGIGEITGSAGNEWRYRGCAGDVVTFTMYSTQFTPYIEMYMEEQYAKDNGLPITEGRNREHSAVIEGVALPVSGPYILFTGGDRRTSRGTYSVTLGLAEEGDGEEVDGHLGYGTQVTGTVRNRFGDLWGFRGCAGDQVTITLESADFTPSLETYVSNGSEPLAKALGNDSGVGLVSKLPLTKTQNYVVMARGESRRARGTYTLTLMSSSSITATQVTPSDPTQEGSAMPAPTATQILRPSPTATATYTPPPPNTATATSTPQPISPATYTPIPTRTPTWTPIPTVTKTPTPALEPQVGVPGGFPGGGFAGEVTTGVGYVRYDGVDDTPIFSQRLYLRVNLFATPNDRPVSHVNFLFEDTETFDVVHSQREDFVGYCSFGGGDPNCIELILGPGAVWPSTGTTIKDGEYEVTIDIYLKGDEEDSPSGSAFRVIEIDRNSGGSGDNNGIPATVYLRPACGSTLEVTANAPLELHYGIWANRGLDLAQRNESKIDIELKIDGNLIQGQRILPPVADIPVSGCREYDNNSFWVYHIVNLPSLARGRHEAQVTYRFRERIEDGYGGVHTPASSFTQQYTIVAQ